jgi:hypothetical protein
MPVSVFAKRARLGFCRLKQAESASCERGEGRFVTFDREYYRFYGGFEEVLTEYWRRWKILLDLSIHLYILDAEPFAAMFFGLALGLNS